MLALACLFLGDSIPLGVGAAYNATAAAPCPIVARQGAGSREIAAMPVPTGTIGTVVISLGSNDDPRFPAQLAANAIARRSSVKAARAIWLLPYNRANAAVVREVAATFGDYAVDLARQPTHDQLHPNSYRPIARALAAFPIE